MANDLGIKLNKRGEVKNFGHVVGNEVKAAIVNAFRQVGGVDYLVTVAQDDPKTFCALLAKCLPSQVKAEIETSGRSTVIIRDLSGDQGATNTEVLLADENGSDRTTRPVISLSALDIDPEDEI